MTDTKIKQLINQLGQSPAPLTGRAQDIIDMIHSRTQQRLAQERSQRRSRYQHLSEWDDHDHTILMNHMLELMINMDKTLTQIANIFNHRNGKN